MRIKVEFEACIKTIGDECHWDCGGYNDTYAVMGGAPTCRYYNNSPIPGRRRLKACIDAEERAKQLQVDEK